MHSAVVVLFDLPLDKDEEGLQTMRTLATVIAWHVKVREAALASGIKEPEFEPQKLTHFVR